MSEYYEVIRKYAIQNRLQHGEADSTSVLGKVISEVPDAKKNIKSLMKEIMYVVDSVNETPLDILEGRPGETKAKRKKPAGSIKLPKAEGEVVMRFAPNPNGPATLGSARGIIINSELAKRYRGKFILRFDDTDPKTKKPMLEAYDWYLDDCEWLDAYPDEVYYASDRISNYYEHAERLIELDKAYVCFCGKEEFKNFKDNKKSCPHRKTNPEKNMKYWFSMVEGRYKEGECVLRIKTDMKHKDPAIRDWVAFRIVKEEHPRIGKKVSVWPMLDFESAIEDHLLGITHIIRGKELIDSEKRQKYIYKYLGWKYPFTLHWGRMKVEEFGKFSTSKLKKDIEEKKYTGWDDPRIPTLMSLRRRGISPKALRNVILDLGIGENDISLSLKNIYSENRKILDSKVDRFFFVADPVELIVRNAPDLTVKVPYHPSFPDRGFREFHLTVDDSGDMRLHIPGGDADKLREGDEIRLKGAFNVIVEETGKKITARYVEKKNLSVSKIQWVQDYINVTVVKPGELVEGFCEPLCHKIIMDSVVQFERYGFVKLDSRKNGDCIFYYAHP